MSTKSMLKLALLALALALLGASGLAKADPPPTAPSAPTSAPSDDPEPAANAQPDLSSDATDEQLAEAALAEAARAEAALAETATGKGEIIEIKGTVSTPGARSRLDLTRNDKDDIHAVLRQIPGVYVREEDGYGLRPNIGIRGAAAERSAKITLMEDGVLAAPAPYSAPAAYYFPLVTRMSGIEVTKGPSAVVSGPSTVGGSVNLVSTPMPPDATARVDAAVGNDLYGKFHGLAADRGKYWGVMAEYVKLRTDGFKELDGGGDTGFDKNDAQLSLLANTSSRARVYHRWDARVGYATEQSNETYTGLTDADFSAAPQRRYRATQDDQMNWDHFRARLSHRVEVGSGFSLETTAYRHQFDRVWGKVDGFVGERDLASVLASPTTGSNPIFYSVLTGDADSSSPEEELVRGINDRTFLSQGVQTRLDSHLTLGPTTHRVDAGVRLHFDRADRRRFEETYRMAGGELVRSDRAMATVLDSRAETLALAVHAQDQVRWRRFTVTGGTRVERISSDFEDRLSSSMAEAAYTVLVPGGGVEVAITPELSALAGVHRGFVPVAPSASSDVQPESSVNYEAGARFQTETTFAETIAFFSDYSNLKGSCSQSTACSSAQDGDEFNGGHVYIWGAEGSLTGDLPVPLPRALRIPLRATYTFTDSAFQSAFESEFAAWGDVELGDELPYLPRHQLSLATGVSAERWEITSNASWHGSARDVAGQGDIPTAERADALLLLGASASVKFARWAELYLTCDNLLDEQVIVSRRPYGARPNAPRRVMLGYRAELF